MEFFNTLGLNLFWEELRQPYCLFFPSFAILFGVKGSNAHHSECPQVTEVLRNAT